MFCVEKRWKIKPHFPEMILTLHTHTASVACGYGTSSSRVRDTDTALGSPSLLLVNPSSWALGAVSRHSLSTEGWGEGRQQIRHRLLPRARMHQQTADAAPSLHIFTPVIPGISQQRGKAAVQGSLCWPLLLRPTTVCSSAHPSCSNEHPLWKFRLHLKAAGSM